MLIDWFTVGAQLLNFLILVWLMKRFLYRPVLNAIDAREQRIAATLADADASKAAARQERDDFQLKNETLDRQRAALLTAAAAAADAERQRMLGAAHREVATLKTKQQEARRQEVHGLHQALVRRTQDEVFAIARQTLTDLAATSLEERISAVFIHRLRALDEAAKAVLRAAFAATSEPALVRSAFDLPAAQRAAVQQAVNETLSADVSLRFTVAPDLVGGIELSANGQKLAWSISDYLGSLEKEVGELLKAKDQAPAPVAPESGVTRTTGGGS